MPGTIQIASIGGTPRALLRELDEPMRIELGLDATAVGTALAQPHYAFNKDRNQYHATSILRRLAPQRLKDQLGVLGVAEVDLFVPDAPFVFSETDRGSRTAIVSIARMRPEVAGRPPNNDLVRARARAEAVHAAGLLIGLSHCDDLRCVMFQALSAADVDRKGTSLCHECRAELARLTAAAAR
jgi:archaemetzincin